MEKKFTDRYLFQEKSEYYTFLQKLAKYFLQSLCNIQDKYARKNLPNWQIGEDSDCAHTLSKQFADNYPFLMDGDGKHFCKSNGYIRCGCGAIVKALDMRNWAAGKGKKVAAYSNEGIYVIYEYNNIQAGGHTWGIDNGQKCGNGLFNGYATKRFKNQQIYKIC